MAKFTYPTLRNIRDTHAWKREYERYMPLSRFVFRPLGFLLTWLAIRVGLTSEAVSWLSGFVALIGCLCLMSSQEQLLPIGIALLLLFNLLDCVDGSIARTMKTENPYGRFLDSTMAWVDMGFWALMGIMVYRHPRLLYFVDPMGYGHIFWLAVGGLTCYFFNLLGYVDRIFNQIVRDEWDSIRTDTKTGSKNVPKDKEAAKASHRKRFHYMVTSIIRRIDQNMRARETYYFFLILAYWGRVVDLLLSIFLCYYALYTILLIIIYCRRGSQLRKLPTQISR